MNIAICGLNSNWANLAIALARHLQEEGHSVLFCEPDYTGAVCLINEGISFQTSKKYYDLAPFLSPQETLEALHYETALIENRYNSALVRSIFKMRLIARANKVVHFYREIIERNRIDLFIVWGDSMLQSAIAKAVTAKLQKVCIHLEKGLLPFTLQVDAAGVNASGSLFELPAVKNTSTVPLKIFQESILREWKFASPLKNISQNIKLRYLLNNGEYLVLIQKLLSYFFPNDTIEYPKEFALNNPSVREESENEGGYIFLPLQVSTDSQVLCHGGWIRSNEELIRVVSCVSARLQHPVPLMIKPHPSEFGAKIYTDIIRKYPHAKMATGGTIDLIRHSAMVVTLNSTVGFEAMIMQKPVIVLGNSFYGRSDLFRRALDEETLKNEMESCMEYTPLQKDVEQYANIVNDNLVHCDFVQPDKNGIEELSRRLFALSSVKDQKFVITH
jgi:hypothetical protein